MAKSKNTYKDYVPPQQYYIGVLQDDPEYFDEGKNPRCKYRIWWKEYDFAAKESVFVNIDVTSWGSQAERDSDNLVKGCKVGVQGTLGMTTTETDEGKFYTNWKISATRVAYIVWGDDLKNGSSEKEEKPERKDERPKRQDDRPARGKEKEEEKVVEINGADDIDDFFKD